MKIQDIPTRHFAPQNVRRRDIAGASAEAHFFITVRARGAKEQVPPIEMGGQGLRPLDTRRLLEKGGRKLYAFSPNRFGMSLVSAPPERYSRWAITSVSEFL